MRLGTSVYLHISSMPALRALNRVAVSPPVSRYTKAGTAAASSKQVRARPSSLRSFGGGPSWGLGLTIVRAPPRLTQPRTQPRSPQRSTCISATAGSLVTSLPQPLPATTPWVRSRVMNLHDCKIAASDHHLTPASLQGIWSALAVAAAGGFWSERTRVGKELSGVPVLTPIMFKRAQHI